MTREVAFPVTCLPGRLIDLHLHLDGSISPASARFLAAAQGIAIPADEKTLRDLLTVDPGCRDLNTYLEKFAFPCRLLQTADALTYAARRLLAELAEEGVIYAEIRFAPQKHTDGGLSQKGAVEAVLAGMRDAAIPSSLILCCMRGEGNDAENRETVTLAAQFAGQGVAAIDLAGAEALYKTDRYAELFAFARAQGVRFTIHAGEAEGAGSVRQAIAFGASRIGHGVRAVEDPALVAELAASGIPLELCPTSNLQTGIFPDLSAYPLPALIDAGVRVTVNTDNRSVSGTTLGGEWEKLIETFSLTREQVRSVLENAAYAAFCDEKTRKDLLEKIKKPI